jgi:phospholipase/lecithinase/hemolysin
MKKTINTIMKLALALVLAVGIVEAKATPFSQIVAFGDSLSDTGNFYRLTGGFPPAPYADGRFSNGKLWIEYLAEDLGMELFAANNFAVAGATTGDQNANDGMLGQEYPGLQDQLAAFLNETGPARADNDALYIIWAGANDFFVGLQTGKTPGTIIGAGVANTVRAVQTLRMAGARHIMVVNVPDLGLTPFGLGSGMSTALTQLTGAYNNALAGALQSLEDAGAPTIQVNAFSALQAMVNSPSEFDFTNVTQPFLSVGGNSSEFLFWDAVHPTTRGHVVLEDVALHSLIDHFSPSQGTATPPAHVNALNGLVETHK